MSFLSFLLPSLISAGSSLAAGAVSANAAGNAANTQSTAATDAARIQANSIQQALDFQKQQFAIQQNNLAPWLNVGQSGLANLASLMGVLPANTPRSGFNMTTAPTPSASGSPSTGNGTVSPYPQNTGYPYPGSLPGDPSFGFGGLPSSGSGNSSNGLYSPIPTPTPAGYTSNHNLPANDNPNPNPTNDGSYGPDGLLPSVRTGGQPSSPQDGNPDYGGEDNGFTGLDSGGAHPERMNVAQEDGGLGNSYTLGGGEFRPIVSGGGGGSILPSGEGPIPRPGQPGNPTAPVTPDAPGPAQGQGTAPVQPGTTTPAQPGQLDTLNSLVNPDLGAFGSLAQDWTQKFNAPTGVTEQNDPGYQFRLDQGMKALNASGAARGTLLSGGTAKAAQRYGQDYASNEYGNVYNRALGEYQQNYNIFQQNNTNKFNRLAALAGVGQQTASELNSAGQNFASNAGNLMVNSGNAQAQGINNAAAARASGYNNQANAYGNALGTAGSDISQLLLLRQLQGGGG